MIVSLVCCLRIEEHDLLPDLYFAVPEVADSRLVRPTLCCVLPGKLLDEATRCTVTRTHELSFAVMLLT